MSSSNYSLNFIIPANTVVGTEASLAASGATFFAPLNIPKNGPNYAILGGLQDLVDVYPQFQTPVIGNQAYNGFIEELNAPTASAYYQYVYIEAPTAQIPVGTNTTSVTATLPAAYGNTNYAVIAVMSNVLDPNPQFQPLLVTALSSTLSWNVPTTTGNNLLTYYAISLTS